MNVIAIINPISGAGGRDGLLHTLFRRLRAEGHSITRRVTAGPGDARRWAVQAANCREAVVLAVGGDGTVNEVADGLVGGSCPMLIWPTGTENLVAKYLGYRADPEAVLATLRAGRISAFDVGIANGGSFLVIVGAGFDAEVVQRLIRLRRGHITHLTYTEPLWRTFWEHRWPELEIAADAPEGPLRWRGRGMAFVGNMARYALNLRVVRDALPDDGLLDLCVMPCRGRIALVGHALRTLRRRHVEHPSVLYRRVTRVRITAQQPTPMEVDGEFAGMLPLEASIRPGALRMMIPPDSRRG